MWRWISSTGCVFCVGLVVGCCIYHTTGIDIDCMLVWVCVVSYNWLIYIYIYIYVYIYMYMALILEFASFLWCLVRTIKVFVINLLCCDSYSFSADTLD